MSPTVAARYGLGTLTAAWTEPDAGSPYDGVWANRVVLQGTAGEVVVSNWDFRNAFGLPSPGFTIGRRAWPAAVGAAPGGRPAFARLPPRAVLTPTESRVVSSFRRGRG